MSHHQPRKKKFLWIFICAFLLLSIGIAAFLIRIHGSRTANNPPADDGRLDEDLAQLSEETYDSVLISMHSSQNFTKEDFLTFLNRNTLIASHTLLNAGELSQYLDCMLQSDNTVSTVYLCLDPELLWKSVGEKSSDWNSSLASHLYSYIENHPDISFEVLLPYPHIDYWLSFGTKKLDRLFTIYHTFVNDLCVYPNAKIFFPGSQYWLMVNRDNYEDSLFDANDIITQKIFLMTFCDALFQITPQNESTFWDTLRETITREQETPTHYPDLSDWCLVFFGDSIFGNFSGSYSIPGYVSGLSGAASYNCGAGGSSASLRPDGHFDFPNVIDDFFTENKLILNDGSSVLYPDELLKGDIKDKKICFVINFGVNDYFSGSPIDNPLNPLDTATYKGSLRYCISRLKERFPEAYYVTVSPTHLGVSTDTQSYPLTDYVEALEEISREMNLYFIDNYDDFVITEENLSGYLPDGCHPNEEGRLAIAVQIMDFIENQMK